MNLEQLKRANEIQTEMKEVKDTIDIYKYKDLRISVYSSQSVRHFNLLTDTDSFFHQFVMNLIDYSEKKLKALQEEFEAL